MVSAHNVNFSLLIILFVLLAVRISPYGTLCIHIMHIKIIKQNPEFSNWSSFSLKSGKDVSRRGSISCQIRFFPPTHKGETPMFGAALCSSN